MSKLTYYQNLNWAFSKEFKKHITYKPGRFGLLACRLPRTKAKEARIQKLIKYIERAR